MFNGFERAVTGRYLRARRGERFVSVIASFSLIGIALGVATLIIVMSVMNGFRHELLSRVIGLNGHLNVFSMVPGHLTDFDALAAKIRKVPAVINVTPTVEGQALVSMRGVASGVVSAAVSRGASRVTSARASDARRCR